ERFVAPTIVEKVLANPDDLEVGGSRTEITVLFADIRGYTAWSEKESPERVVEMLNDYLSLAAELVMAWEGTLDKFFGDGLMAIFNAPEPQAHHSHRAVDAALALLKAAEDMNRQKGYGLSYSVGVNVGEAVVGYIGTDRALNYTAIGDVINIAKRLQERAAPGQILTTDKVIHKIGGLVHGQKLGDMKIRNRQNSVSVYKVKGLDPLP
ncbi:MAG: adenylate/guanylate cyclase domain-containing protein, partial [Chloroflexota bacterium]